MLTKYSRAERRVHLTNALALVLIFILGFLTTGQKPAFALQIDVPLNQALVLEGGESTNPRDYDPATTYGSGDKLVFSGLVSFDPQLNLTADLAEKWEVSADGTVYTFHMRKNAGSPVGPNERRYLSYVPKAATCTGRPSTQRLHRIRFHNRLRSFRVRADQP